MSSSIIHLGDLTVSLPKVYFLIQTLLKKKEKESKGFLENLQPSTKIFYITYVEERKTEVKPLVYKIKQK